VSMDRSEIEDIVKLAVKATVPECVRYTLEHYGFDVHNPTEVQRDLQFTRASRRFFGSIATKVLSVLVIALVSVAAAWAIGAGKLPIGG